jgi:EAL domain-containing protein (putative c-di-GMP-specific phosphodiesterase class I)
MNCPSAQGYWFSRPMSREAVDDYLRGSDRRNGDLYSRTQSAGNA